jgi:hypothetical protein
MAEVGKEPKKNLKYLGLVHALVFQANAYLLALYIFAKDSSGPLRPGLDNFEGAVKTVVGPVYHKIEGKPFELLQFVDSKVDETLALFNDVVVPQFLKEKAYQVYNVVTKQAPEAARAIVAGVQKQGAIATASDYYHSYKPVAEQIIYQGWAKILTVVPYAPQLVDLAAPGAKFSAQQYNQLATALKEKHVPLSCFIPLVPIQRIEEATKIAQAG